MNWSQHPFKIAIGIAWFALAIYNSDAAWLVIDIAFVAIGLVGVVSGRVEAKLFGNGRVYEGMQASFVGLLYVFTGCCLALYPIHNLWPSLVAFGAR